MFDDEQIDPAMLFYQIVCSPEQLARVLNPKRAEDHLLRIQADAINDHVRIYRVMRERARSRGSDTLLLDEYRSDFSEYLSYLPEIERMMCEDIPSGYVLTNNYDAMCLKTDGGRVIVISEVLRYFLYFMNLATLNFPDVPQSVRDCAKLIAVRTLLLTEALDFDLDPRGIVPPHIHAELEGMVKWQMKFVIGHELAHHNLAHTTDTTFRAATQRGDSNRKQRLQEWCAYTREQAQEFEADLESIRIVDAGEGVRYSLFVGGTMFLLHLSLFEEVAGAIDPDFSAINTHPPTLERFHRLIEHFRENASFEVAEIDTVVGAYRRWAKELIDHYRQHPKSFTQYGSIYLEGWRGPVLRDRIDY